MKKLETLIVGGGIAGLSAALQLKKNGLPFKLISENIGGRIESSKDGQVNYGAYLIGADNAHMLKWVTLKRREYPHRTLFHKGKKSLPLYWLFLHPVEFVRFYRLLKKFRKHYAEFKKQAEEISQKEALEKSPFLLSLYKQNGSEFAKHYKVQKIIKNLLGDGVYFCSFEDFSCLNAFDILHILMYLTVPVYEFVFQKEKIKKLLKTHLIKDSMVELERGKTYRIKTKKGETYECRNLILATPISVTQKFLPVKKIKKAQTACLFHVTGELKKPWVGKLNLFDSHSPVIFIAPQMDGSTLVYSQHPTIDLQTYFEKYKILAKKVWEPAFNLGGSILLEAKQGPNFFMIGDYNICGMEDSFITGIYAANQILKNG